MIYQFLKSSDWFQCHIGRHNFAFDPSSEFLDHNTSFDSQMAMQLCRKLQRAKNGCPIVFEVIHPMSQIVHLVTHSCLPKIKQRFFELKWWSDPHENYFLTHLLSEHTGVTSWFSLGIQFIPQQHTCVGKLGQHWFRWWLVTSSAPSHYLNQCKNIVNLTMRNNIRLNLNQNVSFMKCIRKCCQGNVWVNKAAKWNTDVLEAVIYGQLVCELAFIDKKLERDISVEMVS